MLTSVFKSLDALKYTPVHPQWVANSWHLKKMDLVRKHLEHGLCLDIGSGNDDVERHLGSREVSIIKLDYPTTSERYGNRPDIYADVQQLPLDANAADAVIFFEVIEHVPDDETALSEIARSLKDSGLLFISAPFLYPLHDQPFDFKRYTSHGLQRMLEKQGFEVIELRKHGNSITTAMQLLNLGLLDLVKAAADKSTLLALLLAVPAGIACLFSNLVSLVSYRLQGPDALLLGHTVVARKIPGREPGPR
jgi:SAM-dependent methyltransferase